MDANAIHIPRLIAIGERFTSAGWRMHPGAAGCGIARVCGTRRAQHMAMHTRVEDQMTRGPKKRPRRRADTPRTPADTPRDAARHRGKPELPNPPRTTTGRWLTTPKFGSAGSGGLELEPGPERD
jgi:hypothetical protein